LLEILKRGIKNLFINFAKTGAWFLDFYNLDEEILKTYDYCLMQSLLQK